MARLDLDGEHRALATDILRDRERRRPAASAATDHRFSDQLQLMRARDHAPQVQRLPGAARQVELAVVGKETNVAGTQPVAAQRCFRRRGIVQVTGEDAGSAYQYLALPG